MNWTILGILIGIILGIVFDISLPLEYVKYSSLIIVGLIDASLQSLRRQLHKKTQKTPHNEENNKHWETQNQNILALKLFSDILSNSIIAITMTYLGEKISLDLYLAVAIFFTIRIIKNIDKIRRKAVKFLMKKQLTKTVNSAELPEDK